MFGARRAFAEKPTQRFLGGIHDQAAIRAVFQMGSNLLRFLGGDCASEVVNKKRHGVATSHRVPVQLDRRCRL